MATTKSIIENFLWGHTKGKASNLYIDGERLINYNTVIAQRINGRVVLNVTKYSQTTSKHQNYMKRELSDVETVTNIPENTWCLKPFIAKENQENAS